MVSKVLVIGDLHYGAKKNSEKFNQQIDQFIDWCLEVINEQDIDCVIQEGDWFDSRNSVNVLTLNYGIRGAMKLSKAVGRDNFYIIQGNHDLFYLDRNDICSIRSLEAYARIVDRVQMIECGNLNLVMVPWVTSDEQWNEVISYGKKGRVAIGHFELDDFDVTGSYKMQHGYDYKHLKKFDYVLSGHYHTRQVKGNVIYTGTPYPITMNEANQDHGVYMVDGDDSEVYFQVYEGIKVISIKYEDLESELEKVDDFDNTTIRVEFPDDVDSELISETVDMLNEKGFDGVKTKYQPAKVREIIEEAEEFEIERVEDIDQIIINLLEKEDSSFKFDRTVMRAIYKEAVGK